MIQIQKLLQTEQAVVAKVALQFSDVETVSSLWVTDRTCTHNLDEYEPVKVTSFPEQK